MYDDDTPLIVVWYDPEEVGIHLELEEPATNKTVERVGFFFNDEAVDDVFSDAIVDYVKEKSKKNVQ